MRGNYTKCAICCEHAKRNAPNEALWDAPLPTSETMQKQQALEKAKRKHWDVPENVVASGRAFLFYATDPDFYHKLSEDKHNFIESFEYGYDKLTKPIGWIRTTKNKTLFQLKGCFRKTAFTHIPKEINITTQQLAFHQMFPQIDLAGARLPCNKRKGLVYITTTQKAEAQYELDGIFVVSVSLTINAHTK